MALQLVKPLGRGGLGVVGLYKDAAGRHVAIKRMLRPWASDDGHRFRREIAETAKLDHPNIVKVLEAQAEGETPYYAMPYYSGGSLRDRLNSLLMQGKAYSVSAAAGIVWQLAGALGYAHANGVFHRDIKPDNVLFDGKRPVICDWGIGKFIHRQSTVLTRDGGIGTQGYCSPEQWTTGHADARSDIYSLGVVLIELTTGTNDRAIGLSRVPDQLRDLAHAMTHDDPSKRPQTMAVVAEALAPLVTDLDDPLKDFWGTLAAGVVVTGGLLLLAKALGGKAGGG